MCKNCGPLSEGQYNQSPIRWSCIECARQRRKKYTLNHSQFIKQRSHDWYVNNKDRTNQNISEYRTKNKEGIKQKRKQNYLENRDIIKAKSKLYKDAIKLKVISIYTNGKNQCVECHNEDITCLTLDHVNENGAEHRKQIKLSGNGMYLWVIKNNYPKIFQVLCMNCNYRKHFIYKNYRISPIKLDVIGHYSNNRMMCASCNEADTRVLTIDHVNGDGSIHREQHKLKPGLLSYKWMKRNEYPESFQVLCFNCNFKKH